MQFCDIPLVLEGAIETPRLSARARRLPRLVALGADAYLLASRLDYLDANPGTQLAGWTGMLARRDGARIYRQLPWAVFRRGHVVPRAPALREIGSAHERPAPAAAATEF